MKKIFAALCTLMLIPMLALANSDMVSVSELRQQVEAMERWTQTYEAHGRTIEVDIPIYIPNEKELAVYDCSAYTDYIKNPNNEDKTNVYAYNENLKELVKEESNDKSENAIIEVYGNGTELRIMFNSPEELLERRLGQLVHRDFAHAWDQVIVDPPLIAELGCLSEPGFGVILVPVVQPVPDKHIGPHLDRANHLADIFQGLQLRDTFFLRFGQHIFRFGKALVVIAHHGPAFPAAVLALPYGAGSAFSFPCHGFNSSPNRFFRKPPTTSLAALCMSVVTWV